MDIKQLVVSCFDQEVKIVVPPLSSAVVEEIASAIIKKKLSPTTPTSPINIIETIDYVAIRTAQTKSGSAEWYIKTDCLIDKAKIGRLRIYLKDGCKYGNIESFTLFQNLEDNGTVYSSVNLLTWDSPLALPNSSGSSYCIGSMAATLPSIIDCPSTHEIMDTIRTLIVNLEWAGLESVYNRLSLPLCQIERLMLITPEEPFGKEIDKKDWEDILINEIENSNTMGDNYKSLLIASFCSTDIHYLDEHDDEEDEEDEESENPF